MSLEGYKRCNMNAGRMERLELWGERASAELEPVHPLWKPDARTPELPRRIYINGSFHPSRVYDCIPSTVYTLEKTFLLGKLTLYIVSNKSNNTLFVDLPEAPGAVFDRIDECEERLNGEG